MLPSLLHSRHLPHQSLSSTLLNLSASPLSALTLSLSLSPLFLPPCPQMPPMANLFLCCLLPHPSQQASLFTLARPLLSIRLTNKVESKHPHGYTHVHAYTCVHTHLFKASQVWIVSWVLPAICWSKKIAKPRAQKG